MEGLIFLVVFMLLVGIFLFILAIVCFYQILKRFGIILTIISFLLFFQWIKILSNAIFKFSEYKGDVISISSEESLEVLICIIIPFVLVNVVEKKKEKDKEKNKKLK